MILFEIAEKNRKTGLIKISKILYIEILNITLTYIITIVTPSIHRPKSRRLCSQPYIEDPNFPDQFGEPSVNAAEYIEKKMIARRICADLSIFFLISLFLINAIPQRNIIIGIKKLANPNPLYLKKQ